MAAFAERNGNTMGRVEPEIGANKHILDLANGRGIELALGEKVGNSAAQRRGRALKPAVQPPPPTAFTAVVHRLLVIAVSAR